MNNKELIEYLINTKEKKLNIDETMSYDFKQELDLNNNNHRTKIIKYIIAFANTNGENLACIYYGIRELSKRNNKKKSLEICGIENPFDGGRLKDIIRENIYPSINIEVEKVTNDKVYDDKIINIQIIKIFNNTDRPYRLKKRKEEVVTKINKKNKEQTYTQIFTEGTKFYRVTHSTRIIPPTEEDKIIENWKKQDTNSNIFRLIKANLPIILSISLGLHEIIFVVPDKILISSNLIIRKFDFYQIFLFGILTWIVYSFIQNKQISIKSLLKKIKSGFVDSIDESKARIIDNLKRKETIGKIKTIIALIRSTILLFIIFCIILSVTILVILFILYNYARIWECHHEYSYYSSCQSELSVINILLTLITSLIVYTPFSIIISIIIKKFWIVLFK